MDSSGLGGGMMGLDTSVSCFDSEDFSPAEFVNGVISSYGGIGGGGGGETIESFLKTEKLKLEMKAMTLNHELDAARLGLTEKVPGTGLRIQQIVAEAEVLKKQVQEWSRSMSEVEEEEEDAITILSSIDSTKRRMEDALKVLEQADALAEKTKKVVDEFQTHTNNQQLASLSVGELLVLAGRLSDVQKYAIALAKYPVFSKYQKQIEFLRLNLQEAVAPDLSQALQTRSISDAHNYYKIFKSIDAEDNFHSRHLRAKLSEISNLWDSFKPSQGRGFGGWLVGFYEEVKRVVVEFVQMSGDICQDGGGKRRGASLVCMCAKSYKSSMESDPERLPSQSLPELVECYETTREYLNGIRDILDDEDEILVDNSVEESVLAPFFGYQMRYGEIEKGHLLNQLRRLSPFTTAQEAEKNPSCVVGREWRDDLHRDLQTAVGVLEGATVRCLGLTEWGGGGALFVVVFDVISEYLQQFSRLLRALRTVVGLPTSPKSLPNTLSILSSFYIDKQGKTKNFKEESSPYAPPDPPADLDQLTHTGLDVACCYLRALGDVQFMLGSYSEQLLTHLTGAGEVFRDSFSSLSSSSPSVPSEGDLDVSEFPCVYLRSQVASCRKVVLFFENLEREKNNHDRFLIFHRSLCSLRKGVHLFVFEVVFGFVEQQLKGLWEMPVWGAEGWEGEKVSTDAEDLRLPQFSVTPSPYIHHLKQYLLHLYNALTPLSLTPLFSGVEIFTEKGDYQSGFKAGDLSQPVDEAEAEEKVLQWMEQIVQSTTALFLEQILKIKSLTKRGCEQLRMDLECFEKILSLMNLPFDPAAEWVLKFLQQEANVSELKEQCPAQFRKLGDRIQYQRQEKK